MIVWTDEINCNKNDDDGGGGRLICECVREWVELDGRTDGIWFAAMKQLSAAVGNVQSHSLLPLLFFCFFCAFLPV